VLEKFPSYLGIGLDENTAIVVKKDTFRVIGDSYVLMYDKSTENPFYLLKKGDQYDVQKRQIIIPKN
jgi:cyanophycinase